MNQYINPADRDNRLARAKAHAQVSWPVNLIPASVSYTSHGHLLIVGSEVDCRRAAHCLRESGLASLTLLVNRRTDPGESFDEECMSATDALPCHYTRQLNIQGYLGQFEVQVETDEGLVNLASATLGRAHFDLIVDLGQPPSLGLELPPPGYYAASWATSDCQRILAELPDQIGEFEKPRYFHIDPALCAHAGRGKTGCTRCLEVCPADAIVSRQKRIDAWIEIDPYQCHGAGSCASVCPTGAIQYRMPEPQRQQEFVRRLLGAYHEAGGRQPVVRFAEQAYLEREATPPASHVLDVPLEELGAAGLDHWLGALADGACEVRIQGSATLPPRLAALVDDQLAQAKGLLAALGHDPNRLLYLTEGDDLPRDAAPRLPAIGRRDALPNATAKRDALNETLSWLAMAGTPLAGRHSLPSTAPFGDIAIDQAACTMCMSCVAVCPTPALAGGKDQPQLSFREADCVQCGLCDSACPENAIQLVPGFLAAPERLERRICKEEAAFECIRCGKPFATASTIASIKKKLAAHPYFAGEAMARLEMCEDCRVKDVWHEMARNPDAQLRV